MDQHFSITKTFRLFTILLKENALIAYLFTMGNMQNSIHIMHVYHKRTTIHILSTYACSNQTLGHVITISLTQNSCSFHYLYTQNSLFA